MRQSRPITRTRIAVLAPAVIVGRAGFAASGGTLTCETPGSSCKSRHEIGGGVGYRTSVHRHNFTALVAQLEQDGASNRTQCVVQWQVFRS